MEISNTNTLEVEVPTDLGISKYESCGLGPWVKDARRETGAQFTAWPQRQRLIVMRYDRM